MNNNVRIRKYEEVKRNMKVLLLVDELVLHMKEKGITFNEITEDEARAFLTKNNYYMKLASYRANYAKCDTSNIDS